MTLQEYIASLRGRTVAVIGIGVSNTPLLHLLLREGIAVTACDRSERAKLGALAEELEAAGNALDILGSGEPEVLSLTLPGGEERSLVICQKLRFTPKGYPRHGGTILKHPL